MNQIDNAPLGTPFPDPTWWKWFSQIAQALFRPTLTSQLLTFTAVPAQSSQDITVNFPAGTVATNDYPLLSAPLPPTGCSLSAYVSAKDQIKVRLTNATSSAVSVTVTVALTIFKN